MEGGWGVNLGGGLEGGGNQHVFAAWLSVERSLWAWYPRWNGPARSSSFP